MPATWHPTPETFFKNLFVWVCVGLWLIPILIFNLFNPVFEDGHVEIDQKACFGSG